MARGVTLDAGALIAADRGDRRFFVWWKALTRRGGVATVPAPVIAQAWRGPRCVRLAQVIGGCRAVPFVREDGRAVGELLARSGTSDVIDAFVVLTAARRGEDILSADVDDLRGLADHVAGLGRITRLDDLPAS